MGAVLFGFALTSCENIFTIEDAEVDPSLVNSSNAPSPVEGPASEVLAPIDAAEPALCERYCSAVMTNCTGDFSVYTSSDTCRAVCDLLPEGTHGDEVGNSVECRLRAAEAAPSEPSFYCPLSGPGGGGTCGTNCESLCTLVESVCAGELGQWDAASCSSQCVTLPDLGFFSTAPSYEMYKGEHVQCRLFHASSAAFKDAAAHCPHAAGAPPCALSVEIPP
jgi:hypothetical protein